MKSLNMMVIWVNVAKESKKAPWERADTDVEDFDEDAYLQGRVSITGGAGSTRPFTGTVVP